MGAWLSVNGEGIYGSRPHKVQTDPLTPNVWYTRSGDGKTVYAFVRDWPADGILHLGGVEAKEGMGVSLLGCGGGLEWKEGGGGGAGIVVAVGEGEGCRSREGPWTFRMRGAA
jgi:hypothetical protein